MVALPLKLVIFIIIVIDAVFVFHRNYHSWQIIHILTLCGARAALDAVK